MKIRALHLYIVDLPFRFSFNHSLAKRSSSTNLIVKAIVEKNGLFFEGFGEGIPREYVTGETIEQATVLLQEKYFPSVIDQYFSNVYELVDFLAEQFNNFGLTHKPSGASWCALELALLDAACKFDNISLKQLLDVDSKVDAPDSIKYGAVASLTNRKSLIALLTLFKLYGFSTVKLKIGKDLQSDIERIALARKILGNDVIIRVDANCAWSVAQTIEFAQSAQAYNIASIEQPVKADNIAAIVQLSSTIPQPIVLDESLCTVNQALDFVNKQVKADFNIRISKMGGIIAANKIRNIAKQAGVACHLGAQVGESGILTMAGRIFAISRGPFVNHEGAANSFLLKHDLTRQNLTFGYGGEGKLPDKDKTRTGLGITLNERNFRNQITKEFFLKSNELRSNNTTELIVAGEKL